MQVGWIYDRRTAESLKIVVRAAMMHILETAALAKKQEAKLEVVKLLRLLLGVTRRDRIVNEYITEKA